MARIKYKQARFDDPSFSCHGSRTPDNNSLHTVTINSEPFEMPGSDFALRCQPRRVEKMSVDCGH